jgi:hypothetical protein
VWSRGNRRGVEGREGIVEEQREEMVYAWSRGKRGNIVRGGNRRGAHGREETVEEQREERE